MENSTNHSQQATSHGVLIEPSWAYGGAGVYSALVFLIVTGLYLMQLFDCKHIIIQFLVLRIMLSRQNYVLDMLDHQEVFFDSYLYFGGWSGDKVLERFGYNVDQRVNTWRKPHVGTQRRYPSLSQNASKDLYKLCFFHNKIIGSSSRPKSIVRNSGIQLCLIALILCNLRRGTPGADPYPFPPFYGNRSIFSE